MRQHQLQVGVAEVDVEHDGTSGLYSAIADSTASALPHVVSRNCSSLPVPKRQARARPISSPSKRCSRPRSPRHISRYPTYAALGSSSDVSR